MWWMDQTVFSSKKEILITNTGSDIRKQICDTGVDSRGKHEKITIWSKLLWIEDESV